jgi:hypothetical protein
MHSLDKRHMCYYHVKYNMKNYAVGLFALSLAVVPLISSAQTAPLQSSSCTDFPMNLRVGASGDAAAQTAVLNLQSSLVKEGFSINQAELGRFGAETKAAVQAFQEKYVDDILVPFGMKKGTGYFGAVTRLKMQALYGCRTWAPAVPPGSNVSIQVSNLSLDSTGVSATVCNTGKNNLPTVPFRIRLNGINRDFEAIGAQQAGACVSDTWKYETWGLEYDPGSTFTAITLIDPNGVYKSDKLQYPLNSSTTIAVPSIPGYHLSVRSMLLKSAGLQATFCNLGSLDLTSFPVSVMVNGAVKTFDISDAYKSGKCQAKQWAYDNWGLTYVPGMTFNATITVDPGNTYKETNEFDNVATAVGTL